MLHLSRSALVDDTGVFSTRMVLLSWEEENNEPSPVARSKAVKPLYMKRIIPADILKHSPLREDQHDKTNLVFSYTRQETPVDNVAANISLITRKDTVVFTTSSR